MITNKQGSPPCRNCSQHSRFALRIARNHRFLPCLNFSLDGNVVRRASERMARSSSSSCVHHRLALCDHCFRPNTSSGNLLNSGTISIGEVVSEVRCLCFLLFHSMRHFSSSSIYSETDKGKETITPPAPKKSILDRASNRLARTVAQIRTGHWLCAPYLKRVRKNREEQVSDKCWWCGQYRMSRTHVFLRCMHPKLEGARKDFWDRPDEDGKIRNRPTSVGQLLGKSKWEKPLADWITATGVGLVGQDRVDKEDERVERNDGWRREPFL
jgi:hypothetical protein